MRIRKIIKKITKKTYGGIIKSGLLNWMPDEIFLKLSYRINLNRKLNLDDPQTFNEKLQWLKIHDRNPQYIQYVDKYEVRKYIASKFGKNLLIPIYGVWDRVDDIDFKTLPEQYVLKCTHDSGGICICDNKATFDISAAKRKLDNGLRHNLFYWGREWPYKEVKPRIIAEKYMTDEKGKNGLTDYKLMCFGGQVRCAFTVTDRFSENGLKVTFYDREWNRMPFERHYPADVKDIKRPISYDRMVAIAEEISAGHSFMRIDFYEIDGQPFFGEITLYPGNGMEEFTPEIWDKRLGEWIQLGEVK